VPPVLRRRPVNLNLPRVELRKAGAVARHGGFRLGRSGPLGSVSMSYRIKAERRKPSYRFGYPLDDRLPLMLN